jgi:protein phosphatase
MQTPAGRAAGLGRPAPGQGGRNGQFGPPGSGDAGFAADGENFGEWTDEDFTKPRKQRRWLKRSFYTVLALGVIGGGLYGGWRWTQTQFYVGTNDEHVALYRGISQDLGWVSLSKVEKDHPEIELKYLPAYQQKQVKATIAQGGRDEAVEKIEELKVQASACRKNAEQRAVEEQNPEAKKPADEAEASNPDAVTASPSPTENTTSAPSPGPSLSEEEKKLVSLCGDQ